MKNYLATTHYSENCTIKRTLYPTGKKWFNGNEISFNFIEQFLDSIDDDYTYEKKLIQSLQVGETYTLQINNEETVIIEKVG